MPDIVKCCKICYYYSHTKENDKINLGLWLPFLIILHNWVEYGIFIATGSCKTFTQRHIQKIVYFENMWLW